MSSSVLIRSNAAVAAVVAHSLLVAYKVISNRVPMWAPLKWKRVRLASAAPGTATGVVRHPARNGNRVRKMNAIAATPTFLETDPLGEDGLITVRWG